MQERSRHRWGVFRRNNAGTWFFWYWQHGKRRVRSARTMKKGEAETEAERYVAALEAAATPRTPTLREYGGTFYDWESSPWISRQHVKGRPIGRATATMRQGHLKKWLQPRWGDTWLDQLNPVTLETWLAGLNLANQTKNHMLYTLRIITREAARERVIPFDPLATAEPMGVEWRRRDALTPKELGALFPASRAKLLKVWSDPRWAVAYKLMHCTGMRVGEACALLWRHVDLPGAVVLIEQAVKADGVIGPPKNGKARSAWLDDPAVSLLTWWQGKSPQGDPADFVVHGSEPGRHVDPKVVQRAWGPAAEAAKIKTAGRFLGAHALRHTYETQLRHQLPEETLRYMLGHQSRAMSDRYDQATPLERLRSLPGERKELTALLPAPKAKPKAKG